MVTKTLKSARPAIDTATGKVIRWHLEATLSEDGFERDYNYLKEFDEPSKAPTAFSRDELLSFAPASLEEVFAHHKLVSSEGYIPPVQVDNNFSLDSLSGEG